MNSSRTSDPTKQDDAWGDQLSSAGILERPGWPDINERHKISPAKTRLVKLSPPECPLPPQTISGGSVDPVLLGISGEHSQRVPVWVFHNAAGNDAAGGPRAVAQSASPKISGQVIQRMRPSYTHATSYRSHRSDSRKGGASCSRSGHQIKETKNVGGISQKKRRNSFFERISKIW